MPKNNHFVNAKYYFGENYILHKIILHEYLPHSPEAAKRHEVRTTAVHRSVEAVGKVKKNKNNTS